VGGLSESEWVFGYASLVPDGAGGGAVEAELTGYRRCLGVAHDNRRVIPGYKTYFSREDGSQPDIYVAFFDLEVADGMTVSGLALPVDSDRLEALDRRELNYERVDVSGLVDGVSGQVWTYLGRASSRARLARGLSENSVVVSQDYLEKVHGAFRARGKAALREFERSTVTHEIQPMDLDRREVPEPEAV
jgi:cation transport regulator ChaC